jgi:HlyD family secretion protein
MLQRLLQLLPKAAESKDLTAAGTEKLPLAVLEFQSPTAAVIAEDFPASSRMTNYLLAGLVASLLLAAGLIKVEELVIANGEMVSTAPDTVVQNYNASAILRQVKVEQGDFVHKGQVLATLDPTNTQADYNALTAEMQAYQAQVDQLQAQEDGKPYVPDPANPASALQFQTYSQQVGQYNAQMQYYTQQVNQYQTEVNGYNAQAAYYSQRLGIASNIQGMYQSLQNLAVGSKLNTLDATDNTVSLRANLASSQSSAQSTQKQLDATIAQRQAFDQQWKAQISQDLTTAINNLTQTRQQLEKADFANNLVTLVAPQDAVVQSVAPVSAGSVLGAGQELFDLSPVNAPFEIQCDVTSNESGYVKAGDKTTIKFSTLNYLLYGQAYGSVINMSADSINPQDTPAVSSQLQSAPVPGTTPQALYYQATVSVDKIVMRDVPAGFRLMPGMPVEVDIVVGRQSVLTYFLTQLQPIITQSMHEP